MNILNCLLSTVTRLPSALQQIPPWPWPCNQKCSRGPEAQLCTPKVKCTTWAVAQCWKFRDFVVGEFCFLLTHLQEQGPSSAAEIRIRFCVVSLAGSHPIPITPLGAVHSPKGNACLGMSSCSSCSACVSSFVDAHVCRFMNYPLADGKLHPPLYTHVFKVNVKAHLLS